MKTDGATRCTFPRHHLRRWKFFPSGAISSEFVPLKTSTVRCPPDGGRHVISRREIFRPLSPPFRRALKFQPLPAPRLVIPFIEIQVWKDQQKGPFDGENGAGSAPSPPLPRDKTDPHSIAGNDSSSASSKRSRALTRKTRGWHAELRASIPGRAHSYSTKKNGGWGWICERGRSSGWRKKKRELLER